MRQPAKGVVFVLGLVATLVVSAAGFQESPLYQVGDEGVTDPRVLKEVRPSYTPEAMRAKIQGEVGLRTVISVKGEATDIRVFKSLEESLDQEAVKALSKWVFEPARRKGEPVRVEVVVMLSFRLAE